MAKAIMIQGTMSNAGKSLFSAALCRIFKQDGYRVAPFKSQNMALNSFITSEGLEMGRAQAVQAEAAGIEAVADMNPLLLKPVADMGCQVILRGRTAGNMSAAEYGRRKAEYIPEVLEAYEGLSKEYDIIVIEGAGSPAEINLNREDIVNMGMAKAARAPVLLVGDIDRGGVFAQLYGTLMLLPPDEQEIVKGLIVNKFRGDVEILRPGLKMLEEKCGKPVAGVVPFLNADIDDEDSLSGRFSSKNQDSALDIAVIRLPHISDFTDFMPLEATRGVGLRYVDNPRDLGSPDLIILPGSQSTIFDLRWLRESGIEPLVKKLASGGTPVIGICGGYQMLGRKIMDPHGVEGGGEIDGLGLLPVNTEFAEKEIRRQTAGTVSYSGGVLGGLRDAEIRGYETHKGITRLEEGAVPFIRLPDGGSEGCALGSVYGSYIHGFFDSVPCRQALLNALCSAKGVTLEDFEAFDMEQYRQEQYDLLADGVRRAVDMDFIYRVLSSGI